MVDARSLDWFNEWMSLLEVDDLDFAKQAKTLEEILVGLNLAEIVAAFQTLENVAEVKLSHAATLEELLGDELPTILASGFSQNPQSICQRLIRNSHLLLELQERVFIYGGPYWLSVSRTDAHRELAARVSENIKASIPQDDVD